MLSNTSRWLTYLTAILYAILDFLFAQLAAIFAYFGLFDFTLKPGQLIYVGAYFLVGIPIFFVLFREGAGLRRA